MTETRRTRSGRGVRCWAVGLAAASFAALLAAGCNPDAPAAAADSADAWVTIRDARVGAEIAGDREAQRRGLGYRDSLDWGRGMLFLYDQTDFHRFWMKGMRFPIDIVWIRDGRVVYVAHRVLHEPGVPDEKLRTYQAPEVANAVLEVPAGFAEAHRWRRGDRVTIEHTQPRPTTQSGASP